MQTTIFVITLMIMIVVLTFILRAVLATNGTAPSENANLTRTKLLWAMVGFGVLVSVGSLRDWPHAIAGDDAMVVNISSGQWWWETDTTEIPVGKQVEFRVTSEDVNHGLGIYNQDMRLLLQVQAMPNYTNKVVYTFEETGSYRILCMELCGFGHHEMVNEFDVVEASQ